MKKNKIWRIVCAVLVVWVCGYMLWPIDLGHQLGQQEKIYVMIEEKNESDLNVPWIRKSISLGVGEKKYSEMTEILSKVKYHKTWDTAFSNEMYNDNYWIEIRIGEEGYYFSDKGTLLTDKGKFILWNKHVVEEIKELFSE